LDLQEKKMAKFRLPKQSKQLFEDVRSINYNGSSRQADFDLLQSVVGYFDKLPMEYGNTIKPLAILGAALFIQDKISSQYKNMSVEGNYITKGSTLYKAIDKISLIQTLKKSEDLNQVKDLALRAFYQFYCCNINQDQMNPNDFQALKTLPKITDEMLKVISKERFIHLANYTSSQSTTSNATSWTEMLTFGFFWEKYRCRTESSPSRAYSTTKP
jgi:hypothetical protein